VYSTLSRRLLAHTPTHVPLSPFTQTRVKHEGNTITRTQAHTHTHLNHQCVQSRSTTAALPAPQNHAHKVKAKDQDERDEAYKQVPES
jgi:hypothetical protein